MFDRTKELKHYLKRREQMIESEKLREERKDQYRAVNSAIRFEIKARIFLAGFTVSTVLWILLMYFFLPSVKSTVMVDLIAMIFQ